MGDSPVTGRSPLPRRAGVPLLGRELPLNLDLSRREMLKLTGYTSMAAFLAACGTGGTTTTTTTSTGGTVSVGSNQSDPGPRAGFDKVGDLNCARLETVVNNKSVAQEHVAVTEPYLQRAVQALQPYAKG